MLHVQSLFIIALGGGLGAVLRYGMSGAVYRVFGTDFPFGTLFVNILGSVLLGFIMETAELKTSIGPSMKVFLGVGLCGGFTTFSTFSYETWRLLASGSAIPAMLNIIASVLFCLVGLYLGIVVARMV